MRLLQLCQGPHGTVPAGTPSPGAKGIPNGTDTNGTTTAILVTPAPHMTPPPASASPPRARASPRTSRRRLSTRFVQIDPAQQHEHLRIVAAECVATAVDAPPTQVTTERLMAALVATDEELLSAANTDDITPGGSDRDPSQDPTATLEALATTLPVLSRAFVPGQIPVDLDAPALLEPVATAVVAASATLRILALPGLPRSAVREDLVEQVIGFVKYTVGVNVLALVSAKFHALHRANTNEDPSTSTPSARTTTPNMTPSSTASGRKRKRSSAAADAAVGMLEDVTHNVHGPGAQRLFGIAHELIELLAHLVRRVALPTTLLLQVLRLAVQILSVPHLPLLHLGAADVLVAVFVAAPDHDLQHTVVEELVTQCLAVPTGESAVVRAFAVGNAEGLLGPTTSRTPPTELTNVSPRNTFSSTSNAGPTIQIASAALMLMIQSTATPHTFQEVLYWSDALWNLLLRPPSTSSTVDGRATVTHFAQDVLTAAGQPTWPVASTLLHRLTVALATVPGAGGDTAAARTYATELACGLLSPLWLSSTRADAEAVTVANHLPDHVGEEDDNEEDDGSVWDLPDEQEKWASDDGPGRRRRGRTLRSSTSTHADVADPITLARAAHEFLLPFLHHVEQRVPPWMRSARTFLLARLWAESGSTKEEEKAVWWESMMSRTEIEMVEFSRSKKSPNSTDPSQGIRLRNDGTDGGGDVESERRRWAVYQSAAAVAEHVGLLARVRGCLLKWVVEGCDRLKSTAPVRGRCVRTLALLAETDPTALRLREVKHAVNAALQDESISVREAALDLLGKQMAADDSVAVLFLDTIATATRDPGLSVRKRASRILADCFVLKTKDESLDDLGDGGRLGVAISGIKGSTPGSQGGSLPAGAGTGASASANTVVNRSHPSIRDPSATAAAHIFASSVGHEPTMLALQDTIFVQAYLGGTEGFSAHPVLPAGSAEVAAQRFSRLCVTLHPADPTTHAYPLPLDRRTSAVVRIADRVLERDDVHRTTMAERLANSLLDAVVDQHEPSRMLPYLLALHALSLARPDLLGATVIRTLAPYLSTNLSFEPPHNQVYHITLLLLASTIGQAYTAPPESLVPRLMADVYNLLHRHPSVAVVAAACRTLAGMATQHTLAQSMLVRIVTSYLDQIHESLTNVAKCKRMLFVLGHLLGGEEAERRGAGEEMQRLVVACRDLCVKLLYAERKKLNMDSGTGTMTTTTTTATATVVATSGALRTLGLLAVAHPRLILTHPDVDTILALALNASSLNTTTTVATIPSPSSNQAYGTACCLDALFTFVHLLRADEDALRRGQREHAVDVAGRADGSKLDLSRRPLQLVNGAGDVTSLTGSFLHRFWDQILRLAADPSDSIRGQVLIVLGLVQEGGLVAPWTAIAALASLSADPIPTLGSKARSLLTNLICKHPGLVEARVVDGFTGALTTWGEGAMVGLAETYAALRDLRGLKGLLLTHMARRCLRSGESDNGRWGQLVLMLPFRRADEPLLVLHAINAGLATRETEARTGRGGGGGKDGELTGPATDTVADGIRGEVAGLLLKRGLKRLYGLPDARIAAFAPTAVEDRRLEEKQAVAPVGECEDERAELGSLLEKTLHDLKERWQYLVAHDADDFRVEIRMAKAKRGKAAKVVVPKGKGGGGSTASPVAAKSSTKRGGRAGKRKATKKKVEAWSSSDDDDENSPSESDDDYMDEE